MIETINTCCSHLGHPLLIVLVLAISRTEVFPTIRILLPIRKRKHDNRNKETSNYGFLMRVLSATGEVSRLRR